MFLTSAQLEEMTGYVQHAAQIRWLAENGYSFDLRRDGRPNVLVDQVRERQLKNFKRKTVLDLSWMDEPTDKDNTSG